MLAQELGSLTGLRSYYSTALEAFDFLAPLLERLFSRIGDAGDTQPFAGQSDGCAAVSMLSYFRADTAPCVCLHETLTIHKFLRVQAWHGVRLPLERLQLCSVLAAGEVDRPLAWAHIQRCA